MLRRALPLLAAGLVGGLLITAAVAWWTLGPRPPTVTVVRGDTLFLLARDHGVSVADLRRWNGIDGDLIEVGQVLIVGEAPQSAAASPPGPVASPPPSGAPRPRGSATPRPASPTPPTRAALTLPPLQPCLGGPEGSDLEEGGMAASTGLTQAQARTALDAFVHRVLPCIGAGVSPRTALDLEIRVACTGRVSEVRVADPGDWPPAVARCVSDTLGYTPFPPHGLPDGDVVFYPLRYTSP